MTCLLGARRPRPCSDSWGAVKKRAARGKRATPMARWLRWVPGSEGLGGLRCMAERMWRPISKLDFSLTTRRAGSGMCGRTRSRCGAPSIYSARESRCLLVRPRQMGREDSDPGSRSASTTATSKMSRKRPRTDLVDSVRLRSALQRSGSALRSLLRDRRLWCLGRHYSTCEDTRHAGGPAQSPGVAEIAEATCRCKAISATARYLGAED
jgi:hypothetical protein